MKRIAAYLGLVLGAIILYLGLWPVPVEPVSWNAPTWPGYAGVHAVNNKLADIEVVSLGGDSQPEHIVLAQDGKLYAAVASGNILRMNPDGTAQEVYANTGGRPLGFDFDTAGNLIVADALKGLLSMSPDRKVTVLADKVGGDPIRFADAVVIASSGKIYFSDATTRFPYVAGTIGSEDEDVSVLDIVENSATGRILEYDPASKSTRIVARGLSFANGVALSHDEKALFVAETGRYRVWKIDVDVADLVVDPESTRASVVLDNLPGFPDNLMRGQDGRIWLGLTAPRAPILDQLADKPFMRKLILRLPKFLEPAPVDYGHAIAFTEDGEVVADLQDPTGTFPRISGVTETADRLYFHNLNSRGLGWLAPAPDRGGLARNELLSAWADDAGPVQNDLFLPADGADKARHRFSGIIGIPEHAMRTEPAVIQPAVAVGRKTQLFPGIDLAFVSHGDYLLPVDRDILVAEDSESFWQIQVSPGRVWSERGDGGLSRASFPFFLTNSVENETYNGVATFMYDDQSISRLRYQIVQQLSPFMIETRFVASGQPAVDYSPAAIDAKRVVADFEEESEDRLAWHDWTELEEKYGAELFADFDSGIDPAQVVTSGLVIDGVVYVRSMATPYGDYPYPREMRHGVWSVTKTAAGLVTLLRMAEKYGDEILDYKIRDYLNVTAEHDGWDEVTFRHAMSMATGVGTGPLNTSPNNISDGDASNRFSEEDFAAYMAWYLAPSLQEKLDEVFKVADYPWGPGEFARYRDPDIFTLAAALDSLYRIKEGEDADLWNMMVEEVYRPIGIHHMPMNRTIETDRKGVPLLAWGIYVTIDDIAKIAGLLQNGGVHAGERLLSEAGLAEALYETDRRGLPTGEANEFGPKSYHLSLWHEDYVTASGKRYSAPRMVGYGGNIVQLMPNGIIGFRFGNGGDKPLEQMTIIADKIRPFDENARR